MVVTAMSIVSEERTETNAGDVRAVSDVGAVAVTTGVGELGTGISSGDMTAMSDVGNVADGTRR